MVDQYSYMVYMVSISVFLCPFFRFLMCIIYSSLSFKFATNFSTFSVLILSGKKLNHCEEYVNFKDTEHQLQGNIYNILYNITIFIIAFYKTSKFRCFFNLFKTT